MDKKTYDVWVVSEIEGTHAIDICNIDLRGKKGELLGFSSWAVFTSEETAKEAVVHAAKNGIKEKIEIRKAEITYELPTQ